MFSCKQHYENSFPGADPPVILVLAVTLSGQHSSLNMATPLNELPATTTLMAAAGVSFLLQSHLPERAAPLVDTVMPKLQPPHVCHSYGTLTWERASLSRSATIHHPDLPDMTS